MTKYVHETKVSHFVLPKLDESRAETVNLKEFLEMRPLGLGTYLFDKVP